MTNIELAKEIKECPVWDRELLTELCERAGLSEEFEKAAGENFESVIFKAAKILGVKID